MVKAIQQGPKRIAYDGSSSSYPFSSFSRNASIAQVAELLGQMVQGRGRSRSEPDPRNSYMRWEPEAPRLRDLDQDVSSILSPFPSGNGQQTVQGTNMRLRRSKNRYTIGKRVKATRRTLKKKYKKSSKMIKKGASIHVSEFGGTSTTGNKMLTVGFGTPYFQIRRMMFEQIILTLFRKAGMIVQYINQPLEVTAGDQLIWEYIGANNQVATHQFTMGIVDTVQTARNNIEIFVGIQDQGVRLTRITYSPTVNGTNTASDWPKTSLYLDNAKIDLYVKQTYKFQNRTVEVETDAQSDEVDNVPLEGKVFQASRGSIKYFAPEDPLGQTSVYTHIAPDATTGLLSPHGSLDEPFQPGYFLNVKKAGQFKINPGKIQTHVLVLKKKIGLNWLHRALTIALTTQQSSGEFSHGKVKMIQFEKFIDTGGAQAQPIRLGYELNNYFCVKLTPGTSKRVKNTFSYVNINQADPPA